MQISRGFYLLTPTHLSGHGLAIEVQVVPLFFAVLCFDLGCFARVLPIEGHVYVRLLSEPEKTLPTHKKTGRFIFHGKNAFLFF